MHGAVYLGGLDAAKHDRQQRDEMVFGRHQFPAKHL